MATPDTGGALAGLTIRVRLIRGKSGSQIEDEVIHEEMFEDMTEDQVYFLSRLNGLLGRYMSPLKFQAEVIRGSASVIGDLVVACRFRRRQQVAPPGQRK